MTDISHLKVGDEVIQDAVGWNGVQTIAIIERETTTAFVVGGRLFRKDSGRLKGGEGYRTPYIRAASPEKIEEVRTKARVHHLASKLEDTKWRELPLIVLESLAQVLAARAGTEVGE